MLTITVPGRELFNEETLEFYIVEPTTLKLEHSLVSLAKWESRWKKPYLTKEEKTTEETIDYIRCMTITQNVDPMIYETLSADNFKSIKEYIEDPMTATTFNSLQNKVTGNTINGEQVTAELVYYWMIALNIPIDFQKWHFNRLLTLIKVCNIKNQPPKKMSSREIMSRNAALNAARKKRLNTNG